MVNHLFHLFQLFLLILVKSLKFLSEASKNSLILLDELGSGTDPKEGESLAMALIDDFALKDTYLLTTTHYEKS